MAQGVNKVILIGNLGKDPEVRYSKSGTAISRLGLACGERVKKGDTWEDHTEWVDVTVFGKTAENVGQYLQKGRQVYVEGRLRTSKYEKDGETKYRTEVIADVVQFLSGGGERGEKKPTSEASSQEPITPTIEDDLPF